jgi:UDP-glucose 4-epimerase
VKLEGKKFVVIGGAGLIGSHVTEALLREDVGEVVVYDNFVRGTRENLATALEDPRCSVFEHGGDIMQTDVLRAAVDGADGVFHLAALWLLHCQDYPRAAFDVNIRGSFNVFETCIDAGVERLVYSSSGSVYGDAVEELMTEEHPFNFENFYGATKVAGEAMLRAFHHRFGLGYAGLRYMNVYGPRQDYRGAYIAVIMRMLDSIDRGEPLVVYGDGSQAYDFVYVGDCAAANVCAMKADIVSGFYNVGTGIRTSIRELGEKLLDLTDSSVGIRYEPQGPTFVHNRVGSPSRARDEIQFEAQVSLDEGLRNLIAWRAAHRKGVEPPHAPATAPAAR